MPYTPVCPIPMLVDAIFDSAQRVFANVPHTSIAVRLLDLTTIQCGQEDSQFEELSSFLAKTESQLKDFAQQLTAHYLTQIPATPHYSMISDTQAS